jgi:hypothetical protein
MTLLKRKRLLAAKIETTIGTAETLSGSDAVFNAYDIMAQQEIGFDAREGEASFGMRASVPQGYKGKLAFKVDAAWDGTVTEPAWADTFLPACGWVKSGQVFTPRTEVPGTNVKTLTMAVYMDGIRKLLTGCVGTFKLICPTGKAAYFEFEFIGVWNSPTDTAMLSPTYPTASSLRFANSTTTWNSVALILENITLDSGNEMILRESASSTSGYLAGVITSRVPKITANPEAKLIATQDRWGQLLSMAEGIITWDLDGPTNSALTIAAPKAQILNNQEADRGKLVVDQIEWQCNRNGSTVDTEASITFTAAS